MTEDVGEPVAPALSPPPAKSASKMSALDARLKPALDSRRSRNILREVPDSTVLRHRPRQTDFSSNDYLSLSTSSKLKQSFVNKIVSLPRVLGSGGSRLLDGGTLEHAQAIAAHESPRTTKLYDRTSDEITLDEIERIGI